MGELDGRVAIVTGASRGIGAAIAEAFGAAGARIAATARTLEDGTNRLPGTLRDTVSRIRDAGGTAEAFAADLSVPGDRTRLVSQVLDRYGQVDILVNNAAVTYFTPVADFSPRRMALMFEVQVNAPTHLAQLVIPGMRERGQGWILNISSVAARHPSVPPDRLAGLGATVYGMCKAALERLTTGLAAELYADNIAVNSLAPTQVVPTPGTLFHGLTTENDPNAEPPEVMAAAALALCREPAGKVTGRIACSQDPLP